MPLFNADTFSSYFWQIFNFVTTDNFGGLMALMTAFGSFIFCFVFAGIAFGSKKSSAFRSQLLYTSMIFWSISLSAFIYSFSKTSYGIYKIQKQTILSRGYSDTDTRHLNILDSIQDLLTRAQTLKEDMCDIRRIPDDGVLGQKFTDWCVDSRIILKKYRELNFYYYSFENEDIEPNAKIPDERLEKRNGIYRMLLNKTDVLLRAQKQLRESWI